MADVVKLADHPMKLMMANKADKIHQLSREAKVAVKNGDVNGAMKLYNEAIKLGKLASTSQEQAQVLVNRASLWIAQNEFDAAMRDLNQAIQLCPTLSRAYARKGDILLERKDFVAASEVFQNGLEFAPYSAILNEGFRTALTGMQQDYHQYAPAPANQPHRTHRDKFTMLPSNSDSLDPSLAITDPDIERVLRKVGALLPLDDLMSEEQEVCVRCRLPPTAAPLNAVE
jgi:tetratricopeptide (TPR) repeat protein